MPAIWVLWEQKRVNKADRNQTIRATGNVIQIAAAVGTLGESLGVTTIITQIAATAATLDIGVQAEKNSLIQQGGYAELKHYYEAWDKVYLAATVADGAVGLYQIGKSWQGFYNIANSAGGSLKYGLKNAFNTFIDFRKWGTSTANATKLIATVTNDVTKLRLPSSFVSALEKFGKTEGDILTYFSNYHNVRSAENWLNDIEHYLVNNNVYGLTKDETFAIWGYTTNYFYRDLNAWLRKGTDVIKTQGITDLLNSALNKFPGYSGTTISRGLEIEQSQLNAFISSYSNGSTKVLNDFQSCGGSIEASFAGRPEINVIFEIEQLTAKDISDLADGIRYGNPAMLKPELLIKSGGKFLVTKTPNIRFST